MSAPTLGQIDYETCNHRNPDAVPWDLLDPDTRRARERGACEVALRVEPTVVMLRAQCDQLRKRLEAVRTELLRGGQTPDIRARAAIRVLCNPDGSLK
jgi:hypothetical protein